jgi:hypothetical protein
MLSRVNTSRVQLSFCVTRGVRQLALLVLIALTGLARPAFAQDEASDTGGWFDVAPEATEPAPDVAGPSGAESEPAQEDTDPSALTVFRPTLDPYGDWLDDSTYGTVWVPHAHVVGTDFAPYVSRGRWSLTVGNDWVWVSDYPFGWAVFHYGRWVWISGRGWAWIPGRTYANAWVVWRVPSGNYAYVGWAPMPPSWVWRNGVAVGLWYAPPLPYVFCHSSYVFYPHVHYYIVRDRAYVRRIAPYTRVYPSPYRAPARPSVTRPAVADRRAAPTSAVPRGPMLSAARIPASAVPRERLAVPDDPARLGPRAPAIRTVRESPANQRMRTSAPVSVRSAPESAPRRTDERVRTPAAADTTARRRIAPSEVRREPSRAAPTRMRAAPSVPRHSAPSMQQRRIRRP